MLKVMPPDLEPICLAIRFQPPNILPLKVTSYGLISQQLLCPSIVDAFASGSVFDDVPAICDLGLMGHCLLSIFGEQRVHGKSSHFDHGEHVCRGNHFHSFRWLYRRPLDE